MTNVDEQDTRLPEELTSLGDALAWCGRRIAKALILQAEADPFTPAAEVTRPG